MLLRSFQSFKRDEEEGAVAGAHQLSRLKPTTVVVYFTPGVCSQDLLDLRAAASVRSQRSRIGKLEVDVNR